MFGLKFVNASQSFTSFQKEPYKKVFGDFLKTSSTNGSGGGGMGRARIPIFTLYLRNT